MCSFVGVTRPVPETPSYLFSFRFSEKVILMPAIRFGYPLHFLESRFKKCFGMNLCSPPKTFKNFLAKIIIC